MMQTPLFESIVLEEVSKKYLEVYFLVQSLAAAKISNIPFNCR